LLGDRLKKHIPPYSGYNDKEEPAIAVEFTSGAYRLHGLIRVFILKKNFFEIFFRNFINWQIPVFVKLGMFVL